MWKVYFLLGVSGSGKTTLFHELDQIDQDDFRYIPSYTSRDMRDGEINGQKYWHITPEEFDAAIANNEFIERAHSTWTHAKYGSKLKDLLDPLIDGINTIKETDMQWLIKMHESGLIDERFETIFLDIDDVTLTQRLTHRWSEEEIAWRTKMAQDERAQAGTYCDHIIDANRPLEQVRADFFKILGL